MSKLFIPENYQNILPSTEQTEKAIKMVKDMFQANLSASLTLLRVTAPMVVMKNTGLNDDLNGVERAVKFPIKDMDEQHAEVVHSLAKWKRLKLSQMRMEAGRGIYTDMNALRPDEELDNIHSIYVDQWDWEQVITDENRNIVFLKRIVKKIYEAIKVTENRLYVEFRELKPTLNDDIFFITAEELLKLYPTFTSKERENEIARIHKAVFIIGIGAKLSNGEQHDGRAADYDDWSTPNNEGSLGLNGDLILWNDILGNAFEISSMGIRVDSSALEAQLLERGEEHKKEFMFHKMLLNNEFPLTIGGGIGQSRLCMFLLRKSHIGEVQSSIWPQSMIEECKKNNMNIF